MYSPTTGKVTALMTLGDFGAEVRFIQKEGVGQQQVPLSWARSVHSVSMGTVTFFLILLQVFLCRCFAYRGVSSQNSHLKQLLDILHTQRQDT